MKRIPMSTLIDFGVAFMTKKGVPEANARHVAEVIIESEAFRLSTHGIVKFSGLNADLGGRVDPRGEPEVVRDEGATALIDGEGCIAILAMRVARELAVAKAREHGVGCTGVRRTGWVAALGMHLIPIAREGLLAQGWAQSSACLDCAPFGGIDACFSTNPVAVAIPNEGDPIVGDFSTATMSMAAASGLAKTGSRPATPRFLDSEGAPTDDPAVIKEGGSLMFAGGETEGHKGYALSLFNEAMTVVMGGSANNPDLPQTQSFGLTVIDPQHFAGKEYYDREMKRFVSRVKSSRGRPGVEAVRLPGERGFAALAECREKGVPLDDEKLGMLRKIAKENGIAPVDGGQ